jgi:hypothetical protein
MRFLFGACAVWLFILSGGLGCGASGASAPATDAPQTISITSTAFDPSSAIPAKYTADGQNVSPPLAWANAPAKMAALVLIVEDPDAPGPVPFTHWVVANLPPQTSGLQEGAVDLPAAAVQGRNDFGRVGYGGPSPPPGRVHHYHFRVYAVDAMLNLGDAPDRAAVLAALAGHVLAWGELVGTYQR